MKSNELAYKDQCKSSRSSGLLSLALFTDHIIKSFAQLIGILSLISLFITISTGVGLRYLTDHGAGWVNELPFLIFPWLCASAFVLAAQTGSHITVEFVPGMLKQHLKLWLASLVYVFSIILFAWLTISSLTVVEVTSSENYPILGIPTAWAYGATTLSFALLSLTSLTGLLQLIVSLKLPSQFRKNNWSDDKGTK